MATDSLAGLQKVLRGFARARDWEQFHTPKNLAMALSAEVGELVEIFQWLTPEESANIAGHDRGGPAATDELADIAIYLLRLADVLGVDLVAAVEAKIERNERRYPAASVRGRADVPPHDPP